MLFHLSQLKKHLGCFPTASDSEEEAARDKHTQVVCVCVCVRGCAQRVFISLGYTGMKGLGHMRSVYLTSGEIGKLCSKVATLVCMPTRSVWEILTAEPQCEARGSEMVLSSQLLLENCDCEKKITLSPLVTMHAVA